MFKLPAASMSIGMIIAIAGQATGQVPSGTKVEHLIVSSRRALASLSALINQCGVGTPRKVLSHLSFMRV
jgi:hypothetical protein